MADRTVVERAVAGLLKPLGFKKMRATWRRSSAETVLVLNVQKSDFGATLYVNLGVYLRQLGAETTPPEYRCHIRTRLDGLCEDGSALVEALDLESELLDTERQQRVVDVIVQRGLPWLEARETEVKARSALQAEKVPTGLVMAAARKHLGLVSSGG
jgi:hypothetical protein